MILRDLDNNEIEVFLKGIKDDLLKNLYRILNDVKEVYFYKIILKNDIILYIYIYIYIIRIKLRARS
jgi:hypothetical protein